MKAFQGRRHYTCVVSLIPRLLGRSVQCLLIPFVVKRMPKVYHFEMSSNQFSCISCCLIKSHVIVLFTPNGLCCCRLEIGAFIDFKCLRGCNDNCIMH